MRRRLAAFFADDRRGLGLAAGLIGLTFILMLVIPQIVEPPPPADRGTDSFSTSALGHSLLADSLKQSGWTVDRLRAEPRSRIARDGLIVLGEPDFLEPEEAAEILRDLLLEDIPVLLVLPKRVAIFDREGRLRVARPKARFEVEQVLDAFTDLRLKRLGPDEPKPSWTMIPEGCEPPRIEEMQLVEGDNLFPLIETDEGVLLGVYSDWRRDFFVLADPDLIANHGFGGAEANAALAFEAIRMAAGDRRAVYFDEIIHGHGLAGGFWRSLLRYPLVLTVIHGLLALLVMIWAGVRAFGPRLPTPPAVPPGKAFLIDHVARVIRLGRHDDYLVQRYLDDSLREVAAHFHLEGGTIAEIEKRLEPRARARALPFDPASWRRTARRGGHGAIEAARRIHRWKKEMVHGSGNDPRTSGRRS